VTPAQKKANQQKKAITSTANDVEAVVDSTPWLCCQIPYNQSRIAWSECSVCTGTTRYLRGKNDWRDGSFLLLISCRNYNYPSLLSTWFCWKLELILYVT